MKSNVAAAILVASVGALSAPVAAAVTVNDRLSADGTEDIFFNFSGGAFSVQVDPANTNGLADPEIFLFQDNGSPSGALTGSLVGHDDDSGPGLSALISGTLAAGNYVLSVGRYDFTQAEARSGKADFTPMERRFVATFSNGVTISNGPAAVPEPASWAMMVAGFGVIGFALRRRPAASAGSQLA